MVGWRRTTALIGLAGGTFSYTTAEALPVGLLLPMSADLAVSPSDIGMLVTVYGAVVMIASVPLTALVRNVSRRRLLGLMLSGFAIGTAISAVADSYPLVLIARLVTASTHAVFWAVVVPVAAALFAPQHRGRVVAIVFAGGTIALALGVPAGTWLGDLAGWRAPFQALTALGVVVLLVTVASLPSMQADDGHTARGTAPDARRFWLLVAVAVLATSGAIVCYTYTAVFVTEVSALPASSVGAILLVRGLASVVGILAIGMVVDRDPWLALTATVGLQSCALLALFTMGQAAPAAIGLIAVGGLGFAAFTATLGGLVLRIAPGRSDLAAATVSAAVNVGITAGAFLGGLALPDLGVRSTALIGGLLCAVAVVVALSARLAPTAFTRRSFV
jgi:MFS transporter, DHA1 family, inner membrane transport protein